MLNRLRLIVYYSVLAPRVLFLSRFIKKQKKRKKPTREEKMINKETKEVQITQKESTRLFDAIEKLEDISMVDIREMMARARKNVISNFSRLKKVVEARARHYESINLILEKIEQRREESGRREGQPVEVELDLAENPGNEGIELPGSQRLMLSVLTTFLEPHSAILDLVESKIRSVISSVQKYVERAQTSANHLFQPPLLQEALTKLSKIVEEAEIHPHSPTKTVSLLHKQLTENYQKFQEYADRERRAAIRALKAPDRPDRGSEQPKNRLIDKAVLVGGGGEPTATTAGILVQTPHQIIDSSKVRIEMTDSTQCFRTNNLVVQGICSRYFCYGKNRNSYAYNHYGYVLGVVRDGVELYSKEPETSNLLDIVYSPAARYLMYDYRKQSIVRKGIDEKEPVEWWDEETIKRYDGGGRRYLRVSRDGSAVGCRENGQVLGLINISPDGSPGDTCKVVNLLDGVIDCFDLVGNDKVLIVTLKGVVGLYEYNMQSVTSKLVSQTEIAGVETRNEGYFYSAVNEAGDCVAVLAAKKSEKTASRIVMLRIEDGKILRTGSLSLKNWSFQYYYSIAFSQSFAPDEFICGYSSRPTTQLFVYCYDRRNGLLQLKQSFPVKSSVSLVYQLRRFKDLVYGLGKDGTILKVKFSDLNE